MRISGDDEIRLTLQRTGEKLVIRRFLGDGVHFVEVLGDDRLSKDKAEETPEGFLFWFGKRGQV